MLYYVGCTQIIALNDFERINNRAVGIYDTDDCTFELHSLSDVIGSGLGVVGISVVDYISLDCLLDVCKIDCGYGFLIRDSNLYGLYKYYSSDNMMHKIFVNPHFNASVICDGVLVGNSRHDASCLYLLPVADGLKWYDGNGVYDMCFGTGMSINYQREYTRWKKSMVWG